jgi:hypothetical protein
MAIELIVEANAAGARLVSACCELGISLRTLKRWRRAFGGEGDGEDRRKGSSRLVSHRLSEEERQRILLTCNQPEYASLPPVPGVNYLDGSRQLRRRVPPLSPPAMAGGGDTDN